jgi:hypothetical protein
MNGDYDPIETAAPPSRRPWLRKAAVPAVCFVLGLGIMGYLLAHWEAGARFLGVAPQAVEEAKASEPAPAPPPAPIEPMVQYEPPPANPALPGTPAEQDFARRLAVLEQRFGTIDTSSRVAVGSADRTEALVAVFAARRAIDRGVALGFLERVLQVRFPNQPQAVGTIIAAARQPVTLVQLQSELETLGPQLMGAPPNQSWWGAFRDELGSLIVVRRADTPSAEPSQRLERAKRWLQAGEVAAAMAEVQRMPGQEHGADWIARAGRYTLAHRELDRLENAALQEPHAPQAVAAPQPQPARPTQPATRQPAARQPARPQPAPARPAPAPAPAPTAR